MFKKIIFFTFVLFYLFSGKSYAFKPETFVTLSNPVRGLEGWEIPSESPLSIPKFFYQQSTSSAFPVTWLLRYDVVKDATMSAFFTNLVETDKNQSLGAFLEITPSLARAAQLDYPSSGLITGFSQADRKKVVDVYMESFFARFGFYPKSVFAWQLDSYTLQYLQTKYSLLSAMINDEQFASDQNRIWGGYIGSPYFPDKNNSLIPASSKENRVDLALVRWNQPDLFNFYSSEASSRDSSSLINQYQNKVFNEFTYLNFGVENNHRLIDYKNQIKDIFRSISLYRDKFSLHPTSLSNFGDWFKARYPISSPTYFYSAQDPFGKDSEKVVWYQGPFYRIGLKSHVGQTQIIDFRVYNRDLYEDHYSTPNQTSAFIQEIPPIIDSRKFLGSEKVIDLDLEKASVVHSKQWDGWQVSLVLEDKSLILSPHSITFSGYQVPSLSTKDLIVKNSKGRTVWNITPHTPFKNSLPYSWLLSFVCLLGLIFIVKKNNRKPKPKVSLPLVVGLTVSLLAVVTVYRSGLLYPFGMGFWGPNGHDAIFHLSMIEKFSHNPFNLSHPQISGTNIVNYHFFFDFISGLLVRVFGFSSLTFYFQLFPIICGFAIVFLLSKLLDYWKYTPREKVISFILVFLAGSFGFIPRIFSGQSPFSGESAFWANQSVSLFLNPPFALSLVILLVFLNIMVSKESTQQSLRLGTILSLSALGGLLAQTKIYAYLLLLGSLLFSKQYKLFFGVLFIGVLISIPFISFGGGSPFIFSPFWFAKSLFASPDRVFWPQFVSAWQVYEASGSFLKLITINLFALLAFLFGNLGIRFIGIFGMLNQRTSETSTKLVHFIVIFGLVIPMVFIQNINPWNTIQFMYYSLFFLSIFTSKLLSRLNIFLLIPVVLVGVITSTGTLSDYFGNFSSARVSYTEMQALEKLRNLPSGVVLSPLFFHNAPQNTYSPKPLYAYVSTAYISALSGQPEFLSDTINLDITGFNYQRKAKEIQRFYNTKDVGWSLSFLYENKISYVYETSLQKLNSNPSDLKLTKIFDSEEIKVYKFN